MACVTWCILLDIDMGYWFICRMTALAIAAYMPVIYFPSRRERSGVMAIFAYRLDRNMTHGERRLCVLAEMACGAVFTEQIVIHLSHRIKEAGEVATTTLFTQYRNVVGGLTEGIDIVMAGDTIVADSIVIEPYRLPTEIGVTIRTLVMHRNVIHGLPGNDNVVVAVLAATKHFVMIHHGNSLEPDGAVASVATLAGEDVFHRLRRGVKAAIDTVAGDAFSRSACELAADVATFAGDKVVATGQLKSGRRVIESFVLSLRNPNIGNQHSQTQNPPTPLHHSYHGSSPAISTGKTCFGCGSGRSPARNHHCGYPGVRDIYHR
jgi:hypothetical protein